MANKILKNIPKTEVICANLYNEIGELTHIITNKINVVPKEFSLFNATFLIPSGLLIPPVPKKKFLFPVYDCISSLHETYILVFSNSLLYKFLAQIILLFLS